MGAIVVALVALVTVASPAAAQYPPPVPPPSLTVSQQEGPPGYTFTATVVNCVPGQTVVFVLGDQRVEATCSPTSLQATVTLTAPPGLGTYTVTAEVNGTVLSQAIQVIDVPPSTLPDTGGGTVTLPDTGGGSTGGGGAGRPLPSTGSDGVGTLLQTGLILAAVGAGFLVVARQRRRNLA
jgi:LPXTG-motif cell wall-anchored protein